MKQRSNFPERELAAFRRDGFLVVKGMFGPDEIARIIVWVDELRRSPEVTGRWMTYFEDHVLEPDTPMLDRIENFVPYHEELARMLGGEKLLGKVSELMGEPAVLFKDKINFKLSNGRGFEPHQDIQAGWNVYASLFITAMIAIDSATTENGCVEFVAGQHRRGLIGELWSPLREEDLKGMAFVPCIVEPGDAVLFNSFVPHRSAPNLSTRPRRALYATYNSRREGDHRTRYFSDKRKSYPPNIERRADKCYEFKV